MVLAKKEMEVTPGVIEKNFGPELQKSLEVFKDESHVKNAIIDAIMDDKIPGIEKKVDSKTGEYKYNFVKGKQSDVEDVFDALAMSAEKERVKMALKREKSEDKMEKYKQMFSKVGEEVLGKGDGKIKKALSNLETSTRKAIGENTGEREGVLRQILSKNLLDDLKKYSHDEKREIMKGIRKGEVPGIKIRKDEFGREIFDYKGTKESAREVYREVAFNAMEEVVKKYYNAELAKSGF